MAINPNSPNQELAATFLAYCMKYDILVKNRSHGKQVGKTKVSLFEQELEELYISIADRLAESGLCKSAKDMERFYLGLIKRNIKIAATYTKKNYVLGSKKGVAYRLILSTKVAYFGVLGKARNILRDIYRKIKVK